MSDNKTKKSDKKAVSASSEEAFHFLSARKKYCCFRREAYRWDHSRFFTRSEKKARWNEKEAAAKKIAAAACCFTSVIVLSGFFGKKLVAFGEKRVCGNTPASVALELTNRFFAHLENVLYATLYNRASPSPIQHFLSLRLLYSAFNNYKSGTCGYGRVESTKARHVRK